MVKSTEEKGGGGGGASLGVDDCRARFHPVSVRVLRSVVAENKTNPTRHSSCNATCCPSFCRYGCERGNWARPQKIHLLAKSTGS